MVLAVFVVLWFAVLFPIYRRKRAERVVGVSVGTFRHQLRVLRRSGKAKIRPANRLHGTYTSSVDIPPLVPAETPMRPAARPGDPSRQEEPDYMREPMASAWAAVRADELEPRSPSRFESGPGRYGPAERSGVASERERIVSIRAQRLREQRRRAARIRAQRRQAAAFAAVVVLTIVTLVVGLMPGMRWLLALSLIGAGATAAYLRALHAAYRKDRSPRLHSQVHYLPSPTYEAEEEWLGEAEWLGNAERRYGSRSRAAR